jgi:phosphoglycerol transferase MdoB-like AlkP superfamily enzyme
VTQKRVGGQRAVGKVELPLRIALQISWKSIQVRFGRAMITAAGTCLGIAFLVTVLTNYAMAKGGPEDLDPAVQMRSMWLVIMSLLVSAVGISNSMFMAVTERFKEIGTMKCLGAVDSFVVRLFLLESGMLGGVGATIGGLVGFLVQVLVAVAQRKWSSVVGMDWGFMGLSFLGAVIAGMVISVLAAMLPAWRAAQLPPAAALRSEV